MAWLIGVKATQKKIDYIGVYREFLGPDYVEEDEYSTVIANHISWHVKLFK